MLFECLLSRPRSETMSTDRSFVKKANSKSINNYDPISYDMTSYSKYIWGHGKKREEIMREWQW